MKLNEIREARAAKVAEARSIIAAAENAKRSLNTEESAKFDAIKAEISDLEQQEQRASFLDEQERRSGARVVEGGKDTFATLEARANVLEALRAQMEGRSLTGAAAELHKELEQRHGKASHGGILVPLSAFEARANDATSGAKLIGTDHLADQYIGPLRNSLLVKQLGVRTLSGLVGNVDIPKAGASLSVGWVGDGGSVPDSSKTFVSVTLSPKHVGGVTEMSRQLIMQSAPAIEALVRDDLSYAIAAAVDAAIIAGTGANNQPQGIIGRAGVQTAVIPATWADVLDREQLLRAANVNPGGWYTTTAVQTALRKVLKSNVAGAEYIADATHIGDLPSASSNAAPANTAILGDWSQVMVGQWGAVELLVNPFADGPYQRGGVLVRAFASVDVQCRNEVAFVVCTPAEGG